MGVCMYVCMYLEGAEEEEDRVARGGRVEGTGVEDAVQAATQLLHHGLRLSFFCGGGASGRCVNHLIIIIVGSFLYWRARALKQASIFTTCGSRFSRGRAPITTRSDRSKAGR